MADVVDGINITIRQLQNLDERDEEYSEKKALLEDILANLRGQYEIGEGGFDEIGQLSLPVIGDQSPQMSDATLTSAYDGFTPYADANLTGYGGNSTSNDAIPAQPQPSFWRSGNIDNPGLIPESGTFPVVDGNSKSGSVSTPDSGFVRPQKRQRESIGTSNYSASQPHKSIRTTPSPAMTTTTTPTSQSSFDIPDDPDLLALLGGNPAQDLREMREEQMEQQRILDARKQQELADAEFARQLMEQDGGSSSLADSSRPASSASLGNSSQAILDNRGRYRRPTPFAFSSPATAKSQDHFSTSLPAANPETPSYSNYIPNKNEIPTRSTLPQVPSSDFIDLESDEFLNLQPNNVGAHPSSDLVEIDFPTFDGVKRESQAESSTVGAQNPYGVPEAANPSNWDFSVGQFGNSIYDVASNVFNGAYNMLDQQIGSYGSIPMGYGGTSVYGSNIQGSSTDVIDLDTYDQMSYMPQDIFSRHGINAHDPANQDLVAAYRDRVDYITNDPTRTSAEIKSLLENIRPDEDLPPENREGTPEAMTYALMEHQKLGLAWMKSMEEGSNKGGILADDMGLGKTIQALALMVAQKSSDRACKTTLVVCPVALLKQWANEIKSKLKPSHQLKVYTLHSEKRHIDWAKLRTFDVVLTTYGTLATETKRREQILMYKRANPNWRPSGKNDYLPLLGDECQWYRVIIDEAQCIKNKSTKAAIGASLLKAKTRFCMTGTPMMNKVTELYSLIHFLRIKPYCEADKFSRDFTRPLKGQSESTKNKAMRQLQALLKAILLRRTKKSQIDGKPILNLPERTTEASHAAFSEDEAVFYSALESRTQLQFNKYLKAGTVGRNYSNILVLLLRLRQACCHPHLIKDFGQATGVTDVTAEDMKDLARELAPEVVARIKEQSGQNDDAALECPVCMDLAENATIFIPCGHNTCSECFARISDPSQAIADGNAEGRAEAKCPNCRGKITPLKVIDHKVFKKIYMPELVNDDPEADIATTDNSDNDDTTDEDEDDDTEVVDCKGNLRGFIVEEDDEVEEASETEDDGDGGFRAGKTPFEKSERKKTRKLQKGKGKAKEAKPPRKTLAQLKKEGMRNIKARKRYLKRLGKDWIPSAKTEKVLELLREIQARKDPETKQCEKTIIFSQFTSLLDLLEIPIAAENWRYSRYDGSMSATARNDAVTDFMEKKDCKIMLVSLKAGNAGLNLVAGSQVIILDPFWNPFVEEQAIDRAHRIGQQKPVQVHRILIPNTVEDRILALQEKKRALIEGALDENASKNIARLGTRELGFLFDVPT